MAFKQKIKNAVRKLCYGPKADSDSFVRYLRSKGMRIGEDVTIYDPKGTLLDETRPWLIQIGSHVEITHGVVILTHGYDWSVMKGLYGDILGSSGKVTIGDNVFIGMNTTILKGVTVGNNVIIGAGSLVNKNVPDNCVAAGNPARVIMSLEEYHDRRIQAQRCEAEELVREYRTVYGKEPDEQALHEFFWLFTDDPNSLPPCWEEMMELRQNRTFSDQVMKKNKKQFEDLQDFLKQC